MPLHVHFRWGVALVGKTSLLGIAHSVVRKYVLGIGGTLGAKTSPGFLL